MAGRVALTGATVVVVGSVNADLVVRVAHLPAPGETVTGGTLTSHGGGKGANQAIAAARAGARVAFVGAVGRDATGDAALALLEVEGIDVAAVVREEQPTGVALIVVDEGGQNQIAVASGANAAVDDDLVERTLGSLAVEPRAVVLTNFEIPFAGARAAVAWARARDLRWIVDPAPATPGAADDLGPGGVLVPNRDEARALSACASAEDAALELARRTGGAVALTAGADGVLLCRDGEMRTHPARPVEVVDTTGAGDAFSGVLGASLAAELDLAEAVDRAQVAAGLSLQARGARDGLPRARDIDRALV